MKLDIALLIALFTLFFTAVMSVFNISRSNKKETQSDVAQMTTIMVKLENIGAGVAEIKAEMSSIKNDVQENRERIIKMEESVKQAQKRLSELQGE